MKNETLRRTGNDLIHKIFVSSLGVFVAVEIANAVSRAVDGMITGRCLGSAELAAIGLANPYFSIAGVVSGVLATGLKAVCAKSIGEGKPDAANRQFSLTAVVALLVSLCMAVAGLLFATPLSMALGAAGDSAELLPYTRDYIRGLFIGAPALIGISVLSPIVQLDGDGKRVKISVIVLSICTILGDIWNVAVLRGGMLGMGLTTSLAQAIAFVILLLHFTQKDRLFHFTCKGIALADLKEILRTGMPKAVKRACKVFCPVFINRRILQIGAGVAMSAYSVEQCVNDLALIAAAGTAEVMLLVSGIFYGEQDKTAMEKLFREALRYGLGLSAVLGVLLFAGAPLISWAYADDSQEVQALATLALRLLAISLPVACINEAMLGYIQVVSATKASVIFVLLQKFLIPVLSCYAFSALFGVKGLYLGFVCNELFLLVCITAMVWKHAGHFPARIDDWLMLPRDFGIPEADTIELSIENMAQVIELSQRVEDFCQAHDIDKRRSFFLALCIEEMAGNVIRHGFSDGKKHGLQLRILIKDKDLILRMRDDCKPFNITTWRAASQDEPYKGIGIRLVLGMADSITYVNTMRMNNLLIVIPEHTAAR